jgi:hypothetical protein
MISLARRSSTGILTSQLGISDCFVFSYSFIPPFLSFITPFLSFILFYLLNTTATIGCDVSGNKSLLLEPGEAFAHRITEGII